MHKIGQCKRGNKMDIVGNILGKHEKKKKKKYHEEDDDDEEFD